MKTKALFLVGALAISIVLTRPPKLGAFDMCDDQQTFDIAACDFSGRSCVTDCQNFHPPGTARDSCETGCNEMNAMCTSGASFDHDWCETPTPAMDFCNNAR